MTEKSGGLYVRHRKDGISFIEMKRSLALCELIIVHLILSSVCVCLQVHSAQESQPVSQPTRRVPRGRV